MKEGESAGGGHRGGCNPAPPAVPDNTTSTTQGSTSLSSTQSLFESSDCRGLTTTISAVVSTTTPTAITCSVTTSAPAPWTTTTIGSNILPLMSSKAQQQGNAVEVTPASILTLTSGQRGQTATLSRLEGGTRGIENPPKTQHSNVVLDESQKFHVNNPPTNKRQQSEVLPATSDAIYLSTNKADQIVRNTGTTVAAPTLTSSRVIDSKERTKSNTEEDQQKACLESFKELILDYKYSRIRSLREKHLENVAELYFMEMAAVNMMEYNAWRKKAPTPEFLSFSSSGAYRLEKLAIERKIAIPADRNVVDEKVAPELVTLNVKGEDESTNGLAKILPKDTDLDSASIISKEITATTATTTIKTAPQIKIIASSNIGEVVVDDELESETEKTRLSPAEQPQKLQQSIAVTPQSSPSPTAVSSASTSLSSDHVSKLETKACIQDRQHPHSNNGFSSSIASGGTAIPMVSATTSKSAADNNETTEKTHEVARTTILATTAEATITTPSPATTSTKHKDDDERVKETTSVVSSSRSKNHGDGGTKLASTTVSSSNVTTTTVAIATATPPSAITSLLTTIAAKSSTASNILPTTVTATITSSSTKTSRSEMMVPPQGAEIKIPAIGATPVAVSTKLPAAVQQLTQQGHVPGRPLGGRHGMVFGQIPAPPSAIGNASVPLVPGGTPLVPCSTAQGTTTLRRNGIGLHSTRGGGRGGTAGSRSGFLVPLSGHCSPSFSSSIGRSGSSNSAVAAINNNTFLTEYSSRAKQEADVVRRVMELQREGLWTEKRLPKQMEPSRPKAHWDYLLEEMVWLAADFAQERKWKKAAAKKCAKMVQKYFLDKANAAQKAEKAQEAHLKRVAAFISKEVKIFWSSVEKLVDYKHHTKLEEKRKKALDQHLSFIVDQTEKFSQQLAEDMSKNMLMDASANASATSSRPTSPKAQPQQHDASDDEFHPDTPSDDDEETIAKAEEEEGGNDEHDVAAEVAALEKESQMDIDDFLKDLPAGYLESFQLPFHNVKKSSDDGSNAGRGVRREKRKRSTDSIKEVNSGSSGGGGGVDGDGSSGGDGSSPRPKKLELDQEQTSAAVQVATSNKNEEEKCREMSVNSCDSENEHDDVVDGGGGGDEGDSACGGNADGDDDKADCNALDGERKEVESRLAESVENAEKQPPKRNDEKPSELHGEDCETKHDDNGDDHDGGNNDDSNSNLLQDLKASKNSEKLQKLVACQNASDMTRKRRLSDEQEKVDEEEEEEEDKKKRRALRDSDDDSSVDEGEGDEDSEADNDVADEEEEEDELAKKSTHSSGAESEMSNYEYDDDEDDEGSEDESEVENTSSSEEIDEAEDDDALKNLIQDSSCSNNNKDEMINDAAALAESIQPKGNTLSSTNVVTPVPFLLKHTLREYQHIGLDWLVTMNERKLNGILADEMGLGKTIQTIALLAHLACVKGNWGPHLIVVPSSVMLNWEMEFKKWCPGFKILTYYGNQKERKLKRVGWTKPNAFHVCITSYKLVVQDQQSFRRKKWKYLILDEAQNIKNFKSQRWQLLLNFSTERRLLLTGTPLQNDLMELWSLMHFLMPYVFSSHREFKEWFSNPVTGMIEGNTEYNEQLIQRLHKVIRPFLLRRLKSEVEKQMPKKYEHVIMCRLSNRQRFLYDDFMGRAKTKETLQSGNLLSVINVLMQLRKVCNHPNMFEVRPTVSPFQMETIVYRTSRLVCDILEYNPFTNIDLASWNLNLADIELHCSAYRSYKAGILAAPRKLIEEIDEGPEPPPRCPVGKYRFYIRVRDTSIHQNLSTYSNQQMVKIGASPAMILQGNRFVPYNKGNTASCPTSSSLSSSSNATTSTTTTALSSQSSTNGRIGNRRFNHNINPIGQPKVGAILTSKIPPAITPIRPPSLSSPLLSFDGPTQNKVRKIDGNLSTLNRNANLGNGKAGAPFRKDSRDLVTILAEQMRSSSSCSSSSSSSSSTSSSWNPIKTHSIVNSSEGAAAITGRRNRKRRYGDGGGVVMDFDNNRPLSSYKPSSSSRLMINVKDEGNDPVVRRSLEVERRRKEQRRSRLKLMAKLNQRSIQATPIYGKDCRSSIEMCMTNNQHIVYSSWQTRSHVNCLIASQRRHSDDWILNRILKTYEQRCTEWKDIFNNFVIFVPAVCAPRVRFFVNNLQSLTIKRHQHLEATVKRDMTQKLTLLHPIISAMTTQFPDPRLLQFDCGKLQCLDELLKQLKSEHHRVLIFTQMTRMLDILEVFLNYHGHIYLRLDGATKVEQRQMLMERFNTDKRIFCFILSTRSGGVGINLTGADTVIFYDSDWNPTMDAQAQDRCHRIGQTRDVHIYRLVSEKTIEVNILKKANQKRMLSDMAIEGGNFTTSYLKSSTIKDLFNVSEQQSINSISSNTAEGSTFSSNTSTTTTLPACSQITGNISLENDKQSLKMLENALAAAEDEQDVQATRTARAEAAAELAEFDENIPLEETIAGQEGAVGGGAVVGFSSVEQMSRADMEVANLVNQLTPIERYAMRFVEETGAAWSAEQLRAAEEEIEAQKREWEANRLAALQMEEDRLNVDNDAMDDTLSMLTYSRKDATNQVNNRKTSLYRNDKRLTLGRGRGGGRRAGRRGARSKGIPVERVNNRRRIKRDNDTNDDDDDEEEEEENEEEKVLEMEDDGEDNDQESRRRKGSNLSTKYSRRGVARVKVGIRAKTAQVGEEEKKEQLKVAAGSKSSRLKLSPKSTTSSPTCSLSSNRAPLSSSLKRAKRGNGNEVERVESTTTRSSPVAITCRSSTRQQTQQRRQRRFDSQSMTTTTPTIVKKRSPMEEISRTRQSKRIKNNCGDAGGNSAGIDNIEAASSNLSNGRRRRASLRIGGGKTLKGEILSVTEESKQEGDEEEEEDDDDDDNDSDDDDDTENEQSVSSEEMVTDENEESDMNESSSDGSKEEDENNDNDSDEEEEVASCTKANDENDDEDEEEEEVEEDKKEGVEGERVETDYSFCENRHEPAILPRRRCRRGKFISLTPKTTNTNKEEEDPLPSDQEGGSRRERTITNENKEGKLSVILIRDNNVDWKAKTTFSLSSQSSAAAESSSTPRRRSTRTTAINSLIKAVSERRVSKVDDGETAASPDDDDNDEQMNSCDSDNEVETTIISSGKHNNNNNNTSSTGVRNQKLLAFASKRRQQRLAEEGDREVKRKREEEQLTPIETPMHMPIKMIIKRDHLRLKFEQRQQLQTTIKRIKQKNKRRRRTEIERLLSSTTIDVDGIVCNSRRRAAAGLRQYHLITVSKEEGNDKQMDTEGRKMNNNAKSRMKYMESGEIAEQREPSDQQENNSVWMRTTMMMNKAAKVKQSPIINDYSEDAGIEEEEDDGEAVSAIGNSSSMDTWMTHNHLQQDETNTNSTYYNVSEESESDDTHNQLPPHPHLHPHSQSTSVRETGAEGGRETDARSSSSVVSTGGKRTSSEVIATDKQVVTMDYDDDNDDDDYDDSNQELVNVPRTRSKGRVKINLWNLDGNEVLDARGEGNANDEMQAEKDEEELTASDDEVLSKKDKDNNKRSHHGVKPDKDDDGDDIDDDDDDDDDDDKEESDDNDEDGDDDKEDSDDGGVDLIAKGKYFPLKPRIMRSTALSTLPSLIAYTTNTLKSHTFVKSSSNSSTNSNSNSSSGNGSVSGSNSGSYISCNSNFNSVINWQMKGTTKLGGTSRTTSSGSAKRDVCVKRGGGPSSLLKSKEPNKPLTNR